MWPTHGARYRYPIKFLLPEDGFQRFAWSAYSMLSRVVS